MVFLCIYIVQARLLLYVGNIPSVYLTDGRSPICFVIMVYPQKSKIFGTQKIFGFFRVSECLKCKAFLTRKEIQSISCATEIHSVNFFWNQKLQSNFSVHAQEPPVYTNGFQGFAFHATRLLMDRS